MNPIFIRARIAKIEDTIVKYEDAIEALAATNGVQEYTLDTGQGKQTVKRYDIDRLKGFLDGLYDRLRSLESDLIKSQGAAVTNIKPGW